MAPLAAGAQVVVQGVVHEQVSGHPVSGAQVSALPRGPIAWTDTDGRFRLSVSSRPDSLRVIAIGYAATRVALPSGASADVSLVPLTVVLPELLSTAGRFEERAAEVVAPVVTIPQAEIAAQAAVATDQIVSQLPGLQSIPSPPAGTSISIRGIGDSRVLVLMDGEPVGGSLLQNIDLSPALHRRGEPDRGDEGSRVRDLRLRRAGRRRQPRHPGSAAIAAARRFRAYRLVRPARG